MILINELYDLLIAQTRADKRGLSVSIDEFNLFIKVTMNGYIQLLRSLKSLMR
jgi:hypothetical protein